MSLKDLGIIGDYKEDNLPTLLIDGDIYIYRICSLVDLNKDTDEARNKIAKALHNKVDSMVRASGCSKYIMFITTKFNFRDYLVNDYKENRRNKERPINLAWAKRYCIKHLNAYYDKFLEADDLCSLYADEDTIVGSGDKDLRQIVGDHLDEETQKVITVTKEGTLSLKTWVTESGKKEYKIVFSGTIGLYFQLLTGDDTDYIIGCGKRIESVWKSGVSKGKTYKRRKGVGPKEAVNILTRAAMNTTNKEVTSLDAALEAVINEYKKVHGDSWQYELETQANLLHMVREKKGSLIKLWTYDGRNEYLSLEDGVILDENHTPINRIGGSPL